MKPISIFDTDINRVIRGGSWFDSMRFARVAYRYWGASGSRGSDLGFRSYCRIR